VPAGRHRNSAPRPRRRHPDSWAGVRELTLRRMGIGTLHSPGLAVEVFPAGDPLAALAALPGAFALRSSLPDRGAPVRRARWSYFGAEPFAVFRGTDPAVAVAAFRVLAPSAGPPEAAHELGVPFAGGAVGYWAYDYGRRLERL